MSNYRLVSLTRVFGKLLEHIVYSKIMRKTMFCLIGNVHSGKKNTVINDRAKILVKDEQLDTFMLDFENTPTHEHLALNKTLLWIYSFLCFR